jgi:hypothetical protein
MISVVRVLRHSSHESGLMSRVRREGHCGVLSGGKVLRLMLL